jgi:mevalonate kinase
LSKSLKSLEDRKSLHFNLKASSHSALRIQCFKKQITMQDFFEEVSRLVESESQIVLSIMDQAAQRKKSKQIEKFTETDTESLYNMIEREIESTN